MSKKSVGVEFTVFQTTRRVPGTDAYGVFHREVEGYPLPTDNMFKAWEVARNLTVAFGSTDDERFVVQARDVYSDGTKEAWRNVRIPCLLG